MRKSRGANSLLAARKPLALAACLFALLATCRVARAQSQLPWSSWSTIDGNWGGYRQSLADRGIVVSGATIVDLMGNVSGESRAFAPADDSIAAADINFEKLLGLKGLLFHGEFVANVGENLSTKSIGNVLQVATAFATEGYYLGQIYLQQRLFGDTLTIQAGRLTTANNFASLPVFSNYVSFAVNPAPIGLTNNTIYFTSLPSVEWAAVGTIAPTDSIVFAAGAHATNINSGLPFGSQHGLDFSFDGSGGPLEVRQLTYNFNQGSEDTYPARIILADSIRVTSTRSYRDRQRAVATMAFTPRRSR